MAPPSEAQAFTERTVANARWVDPARIAIPSRAGFVDPLTYLSPERRAVLADLSKLKRDVVAWDEAPGP